MKYFFVCLLLLFNLISISSFGQIHKGIIKGKVFDPEFGKIIGANIILLQTNLGAAADTNGNYVIRNVPFGQCVIRCSYIGYPPRTDTIIVTKENPEVTLDFELTIPKIPIVMPDSLQQYHNLIAKLDSSKILEINIDSVSENFDYTYVTITNKTKYPIYLIEDLFCFNTVDEILNGPKAGIDHFDDIIMGCGLLSAIELPKLKNLIVLEPFSTKKFPPVKNYKYRMINSPKIIGSYYLSLKYQMKDYKYIPPFTGANSFDDYYMDLNEEIYVLNRATRGSFFSTNSIIVNFTP